MRTFDLLALLVTDVPRDFHRVANKRVPARVVYRAFHRGLVLDHVDRKTGALRKRAELVVDWFYLNRVKRNKCRLARTLVAHILEHSILANPSESNEMAKGGHTSMQSIAVRSSSTTTASILRPSITEMAVSYFR